MTSDNRRIQGRRGPGSVGDAEGGGELFGSRGGIGVPLVVLELFHEGIAHLENQVAGAAIADGDAAGRAEPVEGRDAGTEKGKAEPSRGDANSVTVSTAPAALLMVPQGPTPLP